MKKGTGIVLKWVGVLWMCAAASVIVVGYVGVAVFQGIGRLLEILSPFNVWNLIAVFITVLPGYGLMKFGEKLRQ